MPCKKEKKKIGKENKNKKRITGTQPATRKRATP
jgi:hypothetical protein